MPEPRIVASTSSGMKSLSRAPGRMNPISTNPTWPVRRTTTRRSPSCGGSTVITAGMGRVERAKPPNS